MILFSFSIRSDFFYILDSISGPAAKAKMTWEKDYFTGSKDQDASVNLAADKKVSPKRKRTAQVKLHKN